MSPRPRVLCAIPARMASLRLPNKPLQPLAGIPMVARVAKIALQAEGVDEVLVATDHESIAEAARAVGAQVAMTPPDCPSGSDRVWAAAKDRDADIIVNLQGDEPLMAPGTVSRVVELLQRCPWADIGTACVPIHDEKTFLNPAVVKVVRDAKEQALYFSRSPIPSPLRLTDEERGERGRLWGHKHLGIYAWRRAALEAFVKLPPSRLELIERLEQLRAMEAGQVLACCVVDVDSIGVDTPEDVAEVEKVLRARGE